MVKTNPKKLRARAEKRLAKTPRDIAGMPAEDLQRQLHELQVHRIELEMQNEELRRKQWELEAALDRYASLYDFAPVALLTLNAQGEIVEANLSTGELLGRNRAALLKNKFTRFLPPEAQDAFQLFSRRVFSTDRQQSMEFNLVTAQAKRRVVQVEALRAEAGSRKLSRFSFTDITERKQAEEALRQSERFVLGVVNSLAAHIAIVDQAGRIVAVNQQWRNFATNNGASPKAVGEGANYLAVCKAAVPKDADIAIIAARLNDVLAGRCDGFQYEYPCHSPTEARWFAMQVTAFAGADHRQAVVAHTDITQRKLAENAVREAFQLNQQVINGAKEGIIVYDRQLKYRVWNPFMEELTGVSAAQVIGKHPLEIFPFMQEKGVIHHINRALAGETLPPMEFQYHVPQSGRTGWALDTNWPLRDARGEINGVVGFVRDITDRKWAEEKIAQLNRVQAILGGVDRAIVHISDQQTLLDEICRVAVEQGGFKLAWVGMVAPDESVKPVAQAGATQYLEGIKVLVRDVPEGRGLVGLAIRENRHVVSENISQDARMAPWQERARRCGLDYAAAFPIRVAGQVAGSFQVYAPRANFFDENELGLLTQVSDEISFALTAIADLAARKQAEEALRRSEHHLSNFFNHAPIGLVWLSPSGTILRANQAQLNLIGYEAEAYLGHSFIEFCGEPAQGLELLKRLATKETVRNFPMTRRCKDGTIRHVLVDANSFWSDEQFQYSSIFLRDVTEIVKLERENLQISEREQRRMAQDLHDGLGQVLVGAAYLAGILRQDLAAKALPEARRLGRILEVINDAIAQTRNLAHGLHPVEPEPNGLMAALETLAARTRKLFQVGCHFNCRRPVLVEDNVMATHLFRIAQEAITNAIKHGKPGRIEISLTEIPGRISLAIWNDGSGMPRRQQKKMGMGLRIMSYRAGMIGGTLAIQKEVAGGTTIVCTVPGPLKKGTLDRPKKAGQKKRSRKE